MHLLCDMLPSCMPFATTFPLTMPCHAQMGGSSFHHNEVRHLTAKLFSEVCHNVEVESNLQVLQPLNNETFHYKTAMGLD